MGSECLIIVDMQNDFLAKREFLKHAPAIMKEFNIPIENVVPHRYFDKRDCHGGQLSDDYFRKFLFEEKEMDEEVGELNVKVVKLEGIVQSLQKLIIMLINMLSKKRLSVREKNNYKLS